MSSPVQSTFEDFEALLALRSNLQRIEEVRNEFLYEAKKCRQEEEFMAEATAEMEDLFRERLLLVEAIRQVNHDIKQLETITKQSESERKQSFDNAKNLLKNLQVLKLEANSICSKYDHESLPENLIDELDEEKFRSPPPPPVINPCPWPIVATAGLSPMVTDPFHHVTQAQPPPAALIPGTEEFNRVLAVTKWPKWPPTTIQPLRLPTANFQEPLADVPGPSNAAVLSKRQQQSAGSAVPLKTCENCQEEIHRNSPTCPICHSKCKSKNPKSSKKRQRIDVNNETSDKK